MYIYIKKKYINTYIYIYIYIKHKQKREPEIQGWHTQMHVDTCNELYFVDVCILYIVYTL